jgi:hypothetical protein
MQLISEPELQIGVVPPADTKTSETAEPRGKTPMWIS